MATARNTSEGGHGDYFENLAAHAPERSPITATSTEIHSGLQRFAEVRARMSGLDTSGVQPLEISGLAGAKTAGLATQTENHDE